MRVGYVTGCYPRVTDTFIRREVAGVRAAGIDVDTFAVRRPTAETLVGVEQRAEHETTTYLLASGVPAIISANVRLLLRSPRRWARAARLAWATRQPGWRGIVLQGAYFAEAGLLAQFARGRRLDHLHNHFGDSSGSVTMLAAELAAVGFSMTVHGSDIFFDRARWHLGEKSARAAFTVCISHFTRSQVMAVAPVEHWNEIHIVHCGVDPALYEEPTPEPGRFRLLTVGRLEQVKGLPILLDAVAKLRADVPEVRLEIVGDGPSRAGLEQLVGDLGLDHVVTFLGSRDQASIRAELRTADVFVLASFAEGLPVVLMEAMAARIPVVATRIMGVPELVADGLVGHLVPPGDADELAGALRRLAEIGSVGRRAMGNAGRGIVEQHFNAATEAARLAELFQIAHRRRRCLPKPVETICR